MTDEIKKVNLYNGIEFWSKILITMSMKLETLCINYGYGEVNVSIRVHNGRVMDIVYSDEIRQREVVKKEKA